MAVLCLETFILKNALVDAGLLWLAAAWRGGRVKPLRILLGALLGTAWALIAAMAGGAFRSGAMRYAVSIGMVWVGLGRTAWSGLLLSTFALWAGAILLGGAVALGLSVPLAGTVTGAAGAALLRRKNAPLPPRVTLVIARGSVLQTIDATVDTGNRALEPLSGLPVIFIEEGVFAPEEGRVLFIRTAAGARALPYFIPDQVTVNGSPVRAVVALASAGSLDCALVPWALCAERMAS